MELKGKTLIVSGASSGIGKALAGLLAEDGVNLVLNARSEAKLETTRRDCGEKGVKALAVPGDVSRDGVAEELVRAAGKTGGFAGFIHAAGVLHPGPTVWELQPDHFAEVFAASVTGAYHLIRVAYPVILQHKHGVAVFFGSGAAEIVQPGIGAYCAAKAAEEHLLRQVAAETSDVTAIVFRPGIVETKMQVQARESTGGAAEALHQVFRPWKEKGELLEPEVAARALIDLLQSDVRQYHGQVVDIRNLR